MTQHLGDFPTGATVHFKWSSNGANGASITRATNGTISVYVGNSVTQLASGVTDTEDFDSLTGVHHCAIDLSSSGTYAAGSECQVVLSGSTIDGQSVNAVLASFSIERAGGVLALLKGTNSLATINGKLPALVGGRVDASVGAMAADVITSSALATTAVTEIQSGLATSAALATVDGIVDAILLDTAEIGAAGAGLTAIPWNAAWDAEVQSEVTDALNAYDPPTNAEMVARTLPTADYATAANLATVDTVADAIKVTTDKLDTTVEADGGVYRYTTNALEQAPTGGGGGGITAADVWEYAVDGSTTAEQSMRLQNSALGGIASGMETTEATFRDLANTKDRITATVDPDGNRTAVVRDLT